MKDDLPSQEKTAIIGIPQYEIVILFMVTVDFIPNNVWTGS